MSVSTVMYTGACLQEEFAYPHDLPQGAKVNVGSHQRHLLGRGGWLMEPRASHLECRLRVHTLRHSQLLLRLCLFPLVSFSRCCHCGCKNLVTTAKGLD